MPGLDQIKSIEELSLTGKRVFLRLDLNVPLDDNLEITSDARIRAALPTIEYCIKQKAKVIIASHLGRPKGPDKKHSLLPVAQRLGELLHKDVVLFEDPVGDGIKGILGGLKDNQILLLENTRFSPGEEKNSLEMASQLAGFTDVYIDDAFGAIHRAHATVAALPLMVPERGCGFLLKKEIVGLDRLLDKPASPYVAILGGSKVSDKIGVIDNLMERVDSFIIGGAMAYTFLAAQNVAIGNSKVERDKVTQALDILNRMRLRQKKLILPIDHVVALDITSPGTAETTRNPAIPDGRMGLDIGPQTIALIRDELARAKTIFWNGPLGAFEHKPFDKGTMAVAQMLAESKAYTVVGGGDSVAAVEQAGLENKMGHVSTGGGASLEYLEGKKLPGLEALRVGPQPVLEEI